MERETLDENSTQMLLAMALVLRDRFEYEPPKNIVQEISREVPLPEDFSVHVIGPSGSRCLAVYGQGSEGLLIAPNASRGDSPTRNMGLDISVARPDDWWSPATFSERAKFLISRPVIKLLGLCHQEHFSIPRFALGISNLAGCIRTGCYGEVSLMDMQVSDTPSQMIQACIDDRADIVGISVTFGQQDLLEEILDRLIAARLNILVIVGGSLATLNSTAILQKYPQVIVSHSAGEQTICELVKFWRAECQIDELNDVEFTDHGGKGIARQTRVAKSEEVSHRSIPVFEMKTTNSEFQLIRTAKTGKRNAAFPLPELDLLGRILSHHGVMQMETTRGCSFACSFCPRNHKGTWYSNSLKDYGPFLAGLSHIYSKFPSVVRRIFLVDEEFFGYTPNADLRALQVAEELRHAGFEFETSARIDQVYRPGKSRQWHLRRLEVWKQLVDLGMSRCLFGVESGVDSILKRFRKGVTAIQNEIGIRLLSLVGVPVRLTYITFDPLMTMEELIASYRFQGRRDLWLSPIESDDFALILDCAMNNELSLSRANDTPLFEHIPYMLVSMECLQGSPYTMQVASAGLSRADNYLMGRVLTSYANPVIGVLSHHAQLWIDRSFALDYTLKSLAKISSGEVKAAITRIRSELRRYAYRLLGGMLVIANEDVMLEPTEGDGELAMSLAQKGGWTGGPSLENLAFSVRALMDILFDDLKIVIEDIITREEYSLDPQSVSIIRRHLAPWRDKNHWCLINGESGKEEDALSIRNQ